MIDENPLKQFLKKQPEHQFIISKYSLALFSAVLGGVCILILSKTTSECSNFRTCVLILAIYHFIDSMTYVHQGYQASIKNDSL